MAQCLSILIFHRVLHESDPLQPDLATARTFESRMRWLDRFFRILPLGDSLVQLKEGRLPSRAVSITFDDGYADNVDIALPILRRLGIPATFFIATGFLNGGRMWNDTIIETVRKNGARAIRRTYGDRATLPCETDAQRRAAIHQLLGDLKYLPEAERRSQVEKFAQAVDTPLPGLMMTESQVRQLAAEGMEVGAHTISHPILTWMGREEARNEIFGSKQELEGLLGQAVPLFAYPNGKPGRDFGEREVEIVREAGFQGAVSTGWGAASARTDFFRLPRFTPWDHSAVRFIGRLALMRQKGGSRLLPKDEA